MQMINQYSQNIDMEDIGLFWQLTIKTMDDLRIIGNENLTLEMYIMQLVHLKGLEYKKEETIKKETSSDNPKNFSEKTKDQNNIEINSTNGAKNQLKSTDQIKTNPVKDSKKINEKLKIEINSFQDLIKKANTEKEIELKYDLERNVKLVSFSKGKIDISFNEKLNKNFIKNLTEKLLLWTNERWIISLSKNSNAKSIYEKNLENKNKEIEVFNQSKVAQDFKSAFPDAELISFTEEE